MDMYVKHQVINMDESMVQNCVLCGECISDYRNAMWPQNQKPPTGWPAGAVFVLKQGSVTNYISETTWDDKNNFINCMD